MPRTGALCQNALAKIPSESPGNRGTAEGTLAKLLGSTMAGFTGSRKRFRSSTLATFTKTPLLAYSAPFPCRKSPVSIYRLFRKTPRSAAGVKIRRAREKADNRHLKPCLRRPCNSPGVAHSQSKDMRLFRKCSVIGDFDHISEPFVTSSHIPFCTSSSKCTLPVGTAFSASLL